MVTMAQNAVNWRNMHTDVDHVDHVDRTHSYLMFYTPSTAKGYIRVKHNMSPTTNKNKSNSVLEWRILGKMKVLIIIEDDVDM